MRVLCLALLVCWATLTVARPSLPTLYEYYSTGNHTILDINRPEFYLNEKELVLYSGSFHYFRARPERWESLLMRYKAAGLNAVQIYVPWNLHEETPSNFDFESPHLDLDRVLRLIKKHDMFAIVRPGPYICAEWEFGGLPAWLLRDPTMKVRTRHPYFMARVEKYFKRVLSIVNRHQWSINNGPVIMFQIENEYFGAPSDVETDLDYLRALRKIVRDTGYNQTLFTSDPLGLWILHNLEEMFPEKDVLETANFNEKGAKYLESLRKKQPNRPLFVTEFWSGWFDQWSEKHHRVATDFFENELRDIVINANASVNFYMFFGGTNFGFMNGKRTTTSYDYDAPLSEDGSYAEKYAVVRKVYNELVQSGRMPALRIPEMPKIRPTSKYPSVNITHFVSLENLLEKSRTLTLSDHLMTMEQMTLGRNFQNETWGANFGFILYRIHATFSASQILIKGQFFDRAIFLRDDIEFMPIPEGEPSILIKPKHPSTKQVVTYDFLVENLGRENHEIGMDFQRKGIEEKAKIFLDNSEQREFQIYALQFNQTFMREVLDSRDIQESFQDHKPTGPALFIGTLNVETIEDTWIDLTGWVKCQVFINDFNLGRYWNVGPQKRLFLPRELLNVGENKISIFELQGAASSVSFAEKNE